MKSIPLPCRSFLDHFFHGAVVQNGVTVAHQPRIGAVGKTRIALEVSFGVVIFEAIGSRLHRQANLPLPPCFRGRVGKVDE